MGRNSSKLSRCLAWGLLLGACSLLAPAFSQPTPEPADPIPIKRVTVPAGREAQVMESLGLTALDRLSLSDFDERLRRVRTASRLLPQLVEARYFRAELIGDALVGKGEWRVRNPSSAAAVLPLHPLSVALRDPRFDTRDAVVAEFEGRGAGLLVEGEGEHTVTFDWSARREPGPDGLQFQLGVPQCAVASLELDLPADLLVVTDGLPLTGPLPAEKAELKRWRVVFSRRPALPLPLTLRRRPEAGQPRVLLAGPLLTREKLTPDAVEADFSFDHIRVQSGEFRELVCTLDPSLRPYDVIAPEADGWELRPPAAAGAAATLVVRLREPLVSGSLIVRCFAPLGPTEPARWTAPGLRLLDAVPEGETLLLTVHPDVSLAAWDPGGFRLVRSETQAEGQVLRLIGGLLADEPGKPARAARPAATVRAHGTEFRARQLALWKVDPERTSFTSLITYEVVRGRLFRLALELPTGYALDSVKTKQDGQIRNWETRTERGKPTLVVDLAQPVAAEGHLRLRVWLHPAASPEGGLVWSFPDLVPLGALLREGGLATDFDKERFDGRISGAVMTTAPPGEDGPWGRDQPDYYGTYRGQPLRGQLELRPVPPRLHARVTARAVLGLERAAVETTLQLQAEAGTPQSLVVYISAPITGHWDWQASAGSNAVVSFERLPAVEAADRLRVLGVRSPLAAAALLAIPHAGEWRRLTLRRALKPRETLTLQATGPLVHEGDGWQIPLIAVPEQDPADSEVIVALAGAPMVRIEASGLHETEPTPGRPASVVPWRTFRYGPPPVALTLRGTAAGDAPTGTSFFDGAVLTTGADPDGRLVHLFHFQAWGWSAPTLPLRLPVGARLLSVKVDGRWVEQVPPLRDVENGPQVDLPVPASRDGSAGRAPQRFEVVYATQGQAGILWSRLAAPSPTLPGPLLTFQRRWRLSPGVLPLQTGTVHALPSASAEPAERVPGEEQLNRLTSLLLHSLTLDDWETRQREQLKAAARAVAGNPGQELTLGEALVHMAGDGSPEREPLVIDVQALQEGGLTPQTPLPGAAREGAPFWDALGLIAISCRPAPLLTTPSRRTAWEMAGQEAGTVPLAVETAVGQAAANGHDVSGRFLWAVAWARRTAAAGRPSAAPWLFEAAPPGWTEWEPVAGAGAGAELTTVRRQPIRAAGTALTVLFLVVLWAARHQSVRRRLGFLLAGLAAAFAGLLWLPTALHGLALGPLLAGAAVGLAWYLWSVARSAWAKAAPSVPPSARASAAAVLALLAGGTLVVTQAAAPASGRATVLVVPGPPEAPDQATVLAPHDLVKQIDALASLGAPHGAVIAGATYNGKTMGDDAEFEARLLIRSFEDGPTTLTLPFVDVRLQDDGLLDGTRAYLRAIPGGATGFLVRIDKPGAHVLVMRFRAAVTARGSERELRFRVPRVPQSQLTMAVPAGANSLQAVTRQGALIRGAAVGGLARFTVELGRADGPVVLHWHEAAAAAPPLLRVREAYLWTLRPESASLEAVLNYQVVQGAPTALTVEVPEALEVLGAEARAAEAGRPAPLLDSWRTEPAGGKRHLRLEFAEPLAGPVVLVLHLLPRRPLAAVATLPLPHPLGAAIERGYLAYRTVDVEAPVANSGRLRGPFVAPAGAPELKAFADLWQTAGEGAPPTFGVLYGVQREPGGDPFLQLRLSVLPPAISGIAEVRWQIGSRQAGLRAVARLTAPAGDLPLVEWDVPADVTVTDVGGRERREPVRHWSRTGTRVQVWLDRAPGAIELELRGWKELTPEAGGSRFDLPSIRLLSADVSTTTVRLGTAPDSQLHRVQTANLLPLPDPHSSTHDLSFRPLGANYGGHFRVARLAADAGHPGVHHTTDGSERELSSGRPRPADVTPLRVVLTERISAVMDGQRWTHEAILWLYHEANTDLHMTMPPRARGLAATVNGLAVTPLIDAEQIGVPLPGAAGPARVRLRWSFDPSDESLDRPRLDGFGGPGPEQGATLWTIHLPADFTASFASHGGRVSPTGLAAHELARAEAQYHLSEMLAQSPRPIDTPALARIQRRFYQLCRYAEGARQLNGAPVPSDIEEQLHRLKDDNSRLARERRFESLRERAERDAGETAPRTTDADSTDDLQETVLAAGPRGDPLPERGVPLRWQTGPDGPTAHLVLTPIHAHQVRRALGTSALLALLLVAIWAVAQFPGLLVWVRAFWPEQVALVGCLGWQTYGPALPLVVLIAVGVSARLILLVPRALLMLHRPSAEPSHLGSAGSELGVEPRASAG